MSDSGFRPRYKFYSSDTPAEIKDAIIKHSKEKNPDNIIVRTTQGHLVLDIPNNERHFWSPHMDVNLEVDQEVGQTLVRCLIGPSPAVWTLFMFFYGFFGFMAFVGLTLGMSQWTLKKDMWVFWFLPIALIGMLLMYFISFEGKKLSKNEMYRLKHFVDDALGCDCIALADTHLDLTNIP